MPWKRRLAYLTGSVNEDLLRRIEYRRAIPCDWVWQTSTY